MGPAFLRLSTVMMAIPALKIIVMLQGYVITIRSSVMMEIPAPLMNVWMAYVFLHPSTVMMGIPAPKIIVMPQVHAITARSSVMMAIPAPSTNVWTAYVSTPL
jgi:hypothetical protein